MALLRRADAQACTGFHEGIRDGQARLTPTEAADKDVQWGMCLYFFVPAVMDLAASSSQGGQQAEAETMEEALARRPDETGIGQLIACVIAGRHVFSPCAIWQTAN